MRRNVFARHPALWRGVIKSRLKHFRRLADLSQKSVATLCGVSRNTVAAWESPNSDSFPTVEQFAVLADALRMEPADAYDWICGGPEHKAL